MIKFISIMMLSVWVMLLSVNSSAKTMDHTSEQLSKVANEACEKYKLPGIAISVYLPSRQQIDVYEGYANNDFSKAVDKNTLFQVGSTTKTYTAVLILKLAAMNRLNLTDTLGKWLPEYPKWSQVTLLQLMNHTSGIYDYIDAPFWWYRLDLHRSKIWTARELVDLAYSHSLYFTAGSGWHYSNTDYVLLGMIVEKSTRMPFKEALNHYVLNNLSTEINHTYYIVDSLPKNISQNLAQGYRNGKRDMTTANTSWLQAGGAVISNAHDLASWYRDIFTRQIVTDSMLEKMTRFVSLESGRNNQNNVMPGYGLGIFTMTTPYGLVWFTPGLTPGYTSLVAWLPCRGIVFSYTANSSLTAKGFHSFLIGKILNVLSAEGANDEMHEPGLTEHFCANEPKADEVNFPKF